MTKIPFFREVIISSFKCEECGFRNNDIQFAGTLPDYGVNIMFRIMNKDDLNRDVIRSEFAKITFEELDFEIPTAGKAEITTIEGLLKRTYD
jgi:zinc finger protein